MADQVDCHVPTAASIDSVAAEAGNLLLQAIDNMSVGVALFDASSRLLLCNQPYLSLYRLKPEVARAAAICGNCSNSRSRRARFSATSTMPSSASTPRLTRARSLGIVEQWLDGTVISIVATPLAGGGWLATA